MPNEKIQIIASEGTSTGERILRLRGALTIHTIFDFQSAIRADESSLLIVDFSGVPYMDSAGLGALVGAYVSAQRAQRKLAFSGMNERLKVTGDDARRQAGAAIRNSRGRYRGYDHPELKT